MLRLTDAAGKQLAVNDDFEDKGAGLITHQADSLMRFTLPANGTYYLHLGDTPAQGRSGVRLPAAHQPARSPISHCAWCPPASTPAAARPCRSPSTPCAATASPARSRWS